MFDWLDMISEKNESSSKELSVGSCDILSEFF